MYTHTYTHMNAGLHIYIIEYICIHNEMLFNHKNEGNLLFTATEMNLEYIMLRKIRQRKTNTITLYIHI
jgi:hypothetical protein